MNTTQEATAEGSTAVTPATAPTTDRPTKLVALVIGLTAVVSLMLLAFAAPSLNSGAHDLPLAVSGPSQATQSVINTSNGRLRVPSR